MLLVLLLFESLHFCERLLASCSSNDHQLNRRLVGVGGSCMRGQPNVTRKSLP